MRVNWSPDERVDIPDMRAVSGFTESEFRRQVSQLHLGYDVGVVLRGFQVEAESPASTRVRVRMDRTSDGVPGLRDSLAIAAENLGGTIDFGLVLGGRNSDDGIEGAAQLLADFSAQPVGSYVVEMRATTTTAQNEKRAFWNEAANAEFVDTADTRVVVAWEVRIVPVSTGGEWLPLAQVAWNGALVHSADILDGRFLLFEGFAIFGFDATDQNLAQFDFARGRDRGTFGVGAPSAYATISALQRQVQDLKGQDEAGKFNWYSRPISAPGGEVAWFKRTKSLRSVDSVSFTVGNSGDYGDFNGVFGLNDCLSFVQANASAMPRRIKIVLKSRQTAAQPVLGFAFRNAVAIADRDIEILNDLGASKFVPGVGDPNKDVRGQAVIVTDGLPLFATALNLTGRSSLKMTNCTWQAPAHQVRQLLVSGPVELRNCVINGYQTGWDFEALTCHSDQSTIEQCAFSGTVNIGGGASPVHVNGGSIRHTEFRNAIVRLRSTVDTTAYSVFDLLQGSAQMVTIEDCTFEGRASFSGSAPSAVGCLDARGATHLTIRNCKVVHSGDEDAVRLGNLASGIDGNSVGSNWVEVANSEFALYAGTAHLFLTGAGGSFGTGHHVVCKHDSLLSDTFATSGINIHHNHFFGGAFGVPGSPDGGAVALWSARNSRVADNRLTDWTDSVAPGTNFLVQVRNDSFPPTDVSVLGNYFGDWTSVAARIICCVADHAFNLHVRGNTFSKYARGTAQNATVDPTSVDQGFALQLVSCNRFWVADNQFSGWRDVGAPKDVDCNLGFGGLTQLGHVERNTFMDFGGAAILGLGGSELDGVVFASNLFDPPPGGDVVEGKFRSAIDLGGAHCVGCSYVGNRWTYAGGTTGTFVKVALDVGDDLSFTLMANHFNLGDAHHATFGGVQAAKATGYAVTSPQLNYFHAYT